MHPLCFPHCGQKHPAVESSSICAQAGQGVTAQAWHSLPGVFLGARRKRLRYLEVGEPLFLFHPPAFRVCIFQLSSPFSSAIQTAALTPSPPLQWKSQSPVHWRAASPPRAGFDHGTALQFLYCCVLTLCVVIWTEPKLSASHWPPPHTGLPCASQDGGSTGASFRFFKSYSSA